MGRNMKIREIQKKGYKNMKKITVKFSRLDGSVVQSTYTSVNVFEDLPPSDGACMGELYFVKKNCGKRGAASDKHKYPRGFYEINAAGVWTHVPTVRYEYATGEVQVVEVASELWVEVCDIERSELNGDINSSGANRQRKCTANGVTRYTRVGKNIMLSDLVSADGMEVSDGADILGDLIAKETQGKRSAALQRGINTLQPQQRELVERIYEKGCKCADIAREEGKSRAAIAQRLARIYKTLRKHLNESGIYAATEV